MIAMESYYNERGSNLFYRNSKSFGLLSLTYASFIHSSCGLIKYITQHTRYIASHTTLLLTKAGSCFDDCGINQSYHNPIRPEETDLIEWTALLKVYFWNQVRKYTLWDAVLKDLVYAPNELTVFTDTS